MSEIIDLPAEVSVMLSQSDLKIETMDVDPNQIMVKLSNGVTYLIEFTLFNGGNGGEQETDA